MYYILYWYVVIELIFNGLILFFNNIGNFKFKKFKY